jgi:pimeloyl-ACP methyl ester carboxylesterase
MTTTTYTVPVTGLDPVEVTVTSYGSGQPFLLLHGGAGPQSVTGFAELLATAHDAQVLVPVHPGFGGTPRPGRLTTIPTARFHLLTGTGHAPQQETPDLVLRTIWDSASTDYAASAH